MAASNQEFTVFTLKPSTTAYTDKIQHCVSGNSLCLFEHSDRNLFFGKEPVNIGGYNPEGLSKKLHETNAYATNLLLVSCEAGLSTSSEDNSFAHEVAKAVAASESLPNLKTLRAAVPPKGITHNVVKVGLDGRVEFIAYLSQVAQELGSELTTLESEIVRIKNEHEDYSELYQLYKLKKQYIKEHPELWPITYADESLIENKRFTYRIEQKEGVRAVTCPTPLNLHVAQLISWSYDIEKELKKALLDNQIRNHETLESFFKALRERLLHLEPSPQHIARILPQMASYLDDGFWKKLSEDIGKDALLSELAVTKQENQTDSDTSMNDLSIAWTIKAFETEAKRRESISSFTRLFSSTPRERKISPNVLRLVGKLNNYIAERQKENWLTLFTVYLLLPILKFKEITPLIDHIKLEQHKFTYKNSAIKKLLTILIAKSEQQDFTPEEEQRFNEAEVKALKNGRLNGLLETHTEEINAIGFDSIDAFLEEYKQEPPRSTSTNSFC